MTYEDVKRIRENPDDKSCDVKELARMIDKAVEKQIAAKVNRNLGIERCRCCGEIVFNGMRYCDACGQRLDWSEEPKDVYDEAPLCGIKENGG